MYEVLIHDYSTFIFNIVLIPVAIFSIIFYLVAIRDIFSMRSKKKEEKKEGKIFPFVTIQIPTLNEPVAIRCAEKCLNFDYPKNKYEIIIGDDSNNKEVSAMIDDFAKKHKNVKVTRRGSNKGFKAGNLNHMLKFSKGEIIVIFDSDFTPSEKFLKEIVQPFADKSVGYVQAKWGYANRNQNVITKLATSILMVYHHLLASINQNLNVALLFGSGEAVRKSAIEELGGWKEGSLTEDVEFSIRALKKGYKAVYLSEIEVEGEVPFTVRGFAKQQRRWAYGNTKAFLDHSKAILFSKMFSLKQRLAVMFTLLGYLVSPFIAVFFITGFMSWFTGTPGAVDVGKFAWETGKILLISSGYMFSIIVSLRKEKQLKSFFHVFFSSLTVGIVVTFYVCVGVLKALVGKGLDWTIIPKEGNKVVGGTRCYS